MSDDSPLTTPLPDSRSDSGFPPTSSSLQDTNFRLPSGVILSSAMVSHITRLVVNGHSASCVPCHFEEMWNRELAVEDVNDLLANIIVPTTHLPHGTTTVHDVAVPSGIFYDILRLAGTESVDFIHSFLWYRYEEDIEHYIIAGAIEMYNDSTLHAFNGGYQHVPVGQRPRRTGRHVDSLPTTPVTTREGQPRQMFSGTPPPFYSPARPDGHPAQVRGHLPPFGNIEIGVPQYSPPPTFSEYGVGGLGLRRQALTTTLPRIAAQANFVNALSIEAAQDIRSGLDLAPPDTQPAPPIPLRSSLRPAANALHLNSAPRPRHRMPGQVPQPVQEPVDPNHPFNRSPPRPRHSNPHPIDISRNIYLAPLVRSPELSLTDSADEMSQLVDRVIERLGLPQTSIYEEDRPASISPTADSLNSIRNTYFENPTRTDVEPVPPFRRASTTTRRRSDGWRWPDSNQSPIMARAVPNSAPLHQEEFRVILPESMRTLRMLHVSLRCQEQLGHENDTRLDEYSLYHPGSLTGSSQDSPPSSLFARSPETASTNVIGPFSLEGRLNPQTLQRQPVETEDPYLAELLNRRIRFANTFPTTPGSWPPSPRRRRGLAVPSPSSSGSSPVTGRFSVFSRGASAPASPQTHDHSSSSGSLPSPPTTMTPFLPPFQITPSPRLEERRTAVVVMRRDDNTQGTSTAAGPIIPPRVSSRRAIGSGPLPTPRERITDTVRLGHPLSSHPTPSSAARDTVRVDRLLSSHPVIATPVDRPPFRRFGPTGPPPRRASAMVEMGQQRPQSFERFRANHQIPEASPTTSARAALIASGYATVADADHNVGNRATADAASERQRLDAEQHGRWREFLDHAALAGVPAEMLFYSQWARRDRNAPVLRSRTGEQRGWESEMIEEVARAGRWDGFVNQAARVGVEEEMVDFSQWIERDHAEAARGLGIFGGMGIRVWESEMIHEAAQRRCHRWQAFLNHATLAGVPLEMLRYEEWVDMDLNSLDNRGEPGAVFDEVRNWERWFIEEAREFMEEHLRTTQMADNVDAFPPFGILGGPRFGGLRLGIGSVDETVGQATEVDSPTLGVQNGDGHVHWGGVQNAGADVEETEDDERAQDEHPMWGIGDDEEEEEEEEEEDNG